MRSLSGAFGWRWALPAVAVAVGIVMLFAIPGPQPALADQPKFYLDCPTTEVREGDSVDVFLVRVTNHQHSRPFGAHWHTDAGTAGTDDYVHQNGGAVVGSQAESLANRVKHTFKTRQDSLAEGNETFTARFRDRGEVVDINDPARDNKCEITIIDDDPNITDIEVTSEPARDNDTYGVGEVIEIQATFNTSVDVDGNPGLGMWVGSNWQAARYLRGSGSDKLVFGYTVQSGDRDSDGIKMDGGYQDSDGRWHNLLNHDTITGTGTSITAHRAYGGIGDQADHKVDGSLTPIGVKTEITSSPASGDTYRHGETIDFSITFSAELEVEGSRHLSLRVGSAGSDGWRGANYKSGSGSDTLVFGYTVKTADLDDDGITMLGTWTDDGEVHGLGGSGAVKVKGTDTVVPPNFSGLSDQSEHKVDGRPYPKLLSITSTPSGQADTYKKDEVIRVDIGFDQPVQALATATGLAAYATLTVGDSTDTREATYASGNGASTLTFQYTVQEGDSDSDGISVTLTDTQNIRSIEDNISFQHDPGGTAPALENQSDHKVDGTPPSISSLAFFDVPGPGSDDTYAEGDWIGLKVTFSEAVKVFGKPQVELDIGGTARQAEYRHLPREAHRTINPAASTSVIFGYTVQEGDVDSDGISIDANKVTLNGGRIKDVAGNDATLTHDAVAADSGHKVDAPDTTAPTVSSVEITSDPGADNTYAVGDAIEVTVTFSEGVTAEVSGTFGVELDVGGVAKTASYQSSTGTDVVFSYTVAAGDSDTDGVSIGANKLSKNDATIRDTANNDATLTHDAVAADSGHLVDGVGPTVSAVSITSDTGDGDTYGVGDVIRVTVTFSEEVTVAAGDTPTSTPQLSIEVGGTTRSASYSSADGDDVVFSYTVVVGDTDADGVAIGANALTLNGGTVTDAQGNAAILAHSAVEADSEHRVFAPGGL